MEKRRAVFFLGYKGIFKIFWVELVFVLLFFFFGINGEGREGVVG